VHLGAGRRAGGGVLDALRIDRLAPRQDVEPRVTVEADEVGLQQLGDLKQ
jgi:hypothetical protein